MGTMRRKWGIKEHMWLAEYKEIGDVHQRTVSLLQAGIGGVSCNPSSHTCRVWLIWAVPGPYTDANLSFHTVCVQFHQFLQSQTKSERSCYEVLKKPTRHLNRPTQRRVWCLVVTSWMETQTVTTVYSIWRHKNQQWYLTHQRAGKVVF